MEYIPVIAVLVVLLGIFVWVLTWSWKEADECWYFNTEDKDSIYYLNVKDAEENKNERNNQ